jgi:hypothetical protein
MAPSLGDRRDGVYAMHPTNQDTGIADNGADGAEPLVTCADERGAMMQWLRRALDREIAVGTLLEAAIWASIPYFLIGGVVVGMRAELLQHMQTLYGSRDQLLSFAVLVAGWPAMLFADVCMY